jgi:hypothetical protein
MTVVPVRQISHRKYTWFKLPANTAFPNFKIHRSHRPDKTMERGMLSLLNLYILEAHIKDLAHIQNLECVILNEKLCLSTVQYGIHSCLQHWQSGKDNIHATSIPNKATSLIHETNKHLDNRWRQVECRRQTCQSESIRYHHNHEHATPTNELGSMAVSAALSLLYPNIWTGAQMYTEIAQHLYIHDPRISG